MAEPTIQPYQARFLGVDRGLGRDRAIVTTTFEVTGLIDHHATVKVAIDGIGERARQDIKWGQSNHPDLPRDVKHPCAFFGIPTAEAAQLHCDTAFRAGSGSNAHILVEEVCEAIEAAHDPVHLRAELVQVMAVAMKWIEQIDRRAGFGGQAATIVGDGELQAAQEVRRG